MPALTNRHDGLYIFNKDEHRKIIEKLKYDFKASYYCIIKGGVKSYGKIINNVAVNIGELPMTWAPCFSILRRKR